MWELLKSVSTQHRAVCQDRLPDHLPSIAPTGAEARQVRAALILDAISWGACIGPLNLLFVAVAGADGAADIGPVISRVRRFQLGGGYGDHEADGADSNGVARHLLPECDAEKTIYRGQEA